MADEARITQSPRVVVGTGSADARVTQAPRVAVYGGPTPAYVTQAPRVVVRQHGTASASRPLAYGFLMA